MTTLHPPIPKVASVIVAIAATLASLITVWSSPAGAAENSGWAVFPTTVEGAEPRNQFIIDLRPGLVYEDSITITNKTADIKTFTVYASDAYNTDVGSFSLRLNDEAKEGIGSWITLPVSEVSLDAGESVDIPFTIDVPADATPGDHAGGIVAVDTEPSESISEDDQLQVDVLQAVGVRIYGRVAGPLVPALEITELQLETETDIGTLFGFPYDATLTYTITNTGNVRIVPTTAGKFSNFLGTGATIGARELPELLPGGSATLTHQQASITPLGKLTAELTVTAPGIQPLTRSVTTWVTPWLLFAVIALAVTGAIVWRRRRRRRLDNGQTDDDLVLVEG